MGMDKQQLIEELQQATAKWMKAVADLSDESFNQRPSEERWSAREIIEHINIIDISAYRMIKSDQSTPTERDPQEKISTIEKDFLNFDKKFTAWGPIIPTKEPKARAEVLDKFQGVRNKLIATVDKQNLTLTCPEFSHPLFGMMTRFEWVHFVNIHTQRHYTQLERALETIKSP